MTIGGEERLEVGSQLRVTLRGGLGNQLFSYALGLQLSRRFSLDLVLDSSLQPTQPDSFRGVSRFPPELQNFAVEGVVNLRNSQPAGATNAFSKVVSVATRLSHFAPDLSSKLGVVTSSNLDSFFRKDSLKPRWIPDLILRGESALELRHEIQTQVRSLKRPSPEYLKLSDQVLQAAPIAVHLREGDYQNLRHLYGPSSPSHYLARAFDLICTSDQQEVWVFSDSLGQSQRKDLGRKKVRFITSQTLSSPLETLLLMSQARGLVGANSTFSWWTALLGGEGYQTTLPYYKDARHNIGQLCAPNAQTVLIPA